MLKSTLTLYPEVPAVVRVTAQDLCVLPAVVEQRITVDDCQLYPELLPNGLPRPSDVQAYAAVRVGGAYRLLVLSVMEAGEWAFIIDPRALDMETGESCEFPVSPALAVAIAFAVNRAIVTKQAKAYARTEGRN